MNNTIVRIIFCFFVFVVLSSCSNSGGPGMRELSFNSSEAGTTVTFDTDLKDFTNDDVVSDDTFDGNELIAYLANAKSEPNQVFRITLESDLDDGLVFDTWCPATGGEVIKAGELHNDFDICYASLGSFESLSEMHSYKIIRDEYLYEISASPKSLAESIIKTLKIQ